jgi:8-oxo-dGTP pyrophosphatase MutT (NUDIX family)
MTSLAVDELLALVAHHQPIDAREAESLVTFRREVVQLADPCNEHAHTTHVTASGVVVSSQATVLHPSAGALREAQEETGLHVRHPESGAVFFHLDVHPGPRGHTHLDLRYLLLAEHLEAPAPGVEESQEVRWFSWAEAAAIADAGLGGALLRAQELIRTYVR